MPRSRRSPSPLAQINLNESFTSLILGVAVVLVASFFVFTFVKNRAQTAYDKINTAISTFQEPQEKDQTAKNQTLKTYKVKAGENLWTIAEKIYGSGYNWVDLAKVNNIKNPDLVFAGNKLVVPVVQKITIATVQPTQNNSPSISGSNYAVVEGDNLWDISVRKYGDGYKWTQIAKTNNLQNPDLIFPANTLRLP